MVSVNAAPGTLATTAGPPPPSQCLWSPGYNLEKLETPSFWLEPLAHLITWNPGLCCQRHGCVLASLLVDPITVTMATPTCSHLVAMASRVFCCPIQVPFLITADVPTIQGNQPRIPFCLGPRGFWDCGTSTTNVRKSPGKPGELVIPPPRWPQLPLPLTCVLESELGIVQSGAYFCRKKKCWGSFFFHFEGPGGLCGETHSPSSLSRPNWLISPKPLSLGGTCTIQPQWHGPHLQLAAAV